MSNWLAESIDDVSSPYDKARFEAGYAVVKDPPRICQRCDHPEHTGKVCECLCRHPWPQLS